jgi:hypothetical protein
MKITLFYLITDEHVIAEENENCNSDSYYEIQNPLAIGIVENSFVMMPFSLISQNGLIKLHKSAVVYTTEPKTKFINAYKERVGGILTPESRVLTT